jgi:hypothetical protein
MFGERVECRSPLCTALFHNRSAGELRVRHDDRHLATSVRQQIEPHGGRDVVRVVQMARRGGVSLLDCAEPIEDVNASSHVRFFLGPLRPKRCPWTHSVPVAQ